MNEADFLAALSELTAMSMEEMQTLSGERDFMATPLNRLAIDSLYLLELQLGLEDTYGLSFESKGFALTPDVTLRDIFVRFHPA